MDRLEKAKKQASTIEECYADVENAAGMDKDYKLKLSRSLIRNLCANHFETLENTIKSTIEAAGITASELVSCEVIGGNSR